MTASVSDKTSQYVTFRLGEEIFALSVTRVLEVLDVMPLTKVPQSAPFMCGVINVRGNVVPVVDLRLKFGLTPEEKTLTTRIMVVEFCMDGAMAVTGALADAVLDVMEIPEASIEPPPRVGTGRGIEYISGIARLGEAFIMILDIDRVFSEDGEPAAQIADTEAEAADQ